MKRIAHWHGHTFLILEAELGHDRRLRITPAEVAGHLHVLNNYVMQIIYKDGSRDGWRHGRMVSIARGKMMGEIEKSISACIKGTDKTVEFELAFGGKLRITPSELELHTGHPYPERTGPLSREMLIDIKEAVSVAIEEEKMRVAKYDIETGLPRTKDKKRTKEFKAKK